MAPTITTLNATEGYASLTILTQAQLNAMVASIETYCNTQLRLNLEQMAYDVLGDTYSFNDDGVQTRINPVVTDYAQKAAAESITGAWSFSNNLSFTGKVSSTNTFTSTGQQRVRCYLTTLDQSLADATAAAILFNAETYDVGLLHDVGSNPNRITIPANASGTYIFNAQVTFDANVTGRREIYLYKNGAKIAETKLFGNSATEETVLNIYCQELCTDGDFFEVYAYQNSSGALDVLKGERVTFFSCIKVW